MRGTSVPGSPAPIGLLGLLRSWLRTGPSECNQAPKDLPAAVGGSKPDRNGQIRVLAVDDNPANLAVISALLDSRGLVTVLAQDGAEAVALACEMHFDLVLMDLQMPVLDGLSATAEIRRCEKAHSRPAVPVVAYSSMPPTAGILAACGIDGSLAKPCDDQELEDCLVQWCPRYRQTPTAPALPFRGGGQVAKKNPGPLGAWLR